MTVITASNKMIIRFMQIPIYRTKKYPRATNAIPAITLIETYAANLLVFPVWSMINAPFENVENAVNPPHNLASQ